MSATLFAGDNTILIEIAGLANASSGEQIDDATVTCTVYEGETETAASGTWPVSLTASGSDGHYSGTFNGDFTANCKYTITVSAVSGVNLAEFSETVLAKKRRF